MKSFYWFPTFKDLEFIVAEATRRQDHAIAVNARATINTQLTARDIGYKLHFDHVLGIVCFCSIRGLDYTQLKWNDRDNKTDLEVLPSGKTFHVHTSSHGDGLLLAQKFDNKAEIQILIVGSLTTGLRYVGFCSHDELYSEERSFPRGANAGTPTFFRWQFELNKELPA